MARSIIVLLACWILLSTAAAVRAEPRTVPPEIEARFKQAVDLSRVNDLPEAMQIAYEILQQEPDYVEAHRLYIDLLTAQGRAEDALHFYRLALDAAPDSAAAHYLYGRATNDPTIAEQEFRRAIELDPDFAWAHHGLGAALMLAGDVDAAIAEFERAIAIDPSLSEAHNHLANLYLSLEREDDAIAAYRRAIELDPEEADAYFYLGAYLAHHERRDEARDLLEEAVRLDDHNPMIYLELGSLYMALQQPRRALDALDAGLQFAPRDEYLRDLRAVAAAIADGDAPQELFQPFRRGLEALALDPQAALDAFDECVAMAPDFYLSHLNRGIALASLVRNEEAESAIRQSILLNPRHAEAHASLALVLMADQRNEEAEASLQQALVLDPAHVESLRGMGMVYLLQDRADVAASYFLRAAAVEPADLTLRLELANAYVQAGDMDQAESSFRQVLRTDPSFNFARYQLAALLNEQGRHDEAIAELELLKQRVVNAAEIQQLIDQVKSQRRLADRESAPRIRLRQIIVRDQDLAESIASRLAAGEEFATLARNHSIGPTAADGGDIGEVSLADLTPAIASAVEGIGVGEVSPIIEARGSYLILQRTE